MELWDALRSRRSIRKFLNKPVEKEVILSLLEAANLAPNSGNSQPWDFVVVNDRNTGQKLVQILCNVHKKYFGQARIDALDGEKLDKMLSYYSGMVEGPSFIVACMRRKSIQLHSEYAAWEKQWGRFSVALAVGNIMMASVDGGLGTCWLATAGWQEDDIKELLHIPNDAEIVAILPVGYPDEFPKSRPRRSIEESVHFEKW